MELARIKNNNIEDKFRVHFSKANYAPIGNSIRTKVKRIYIKRKKKVVSEFCVFIVNNEETSDTLMLIPIHMVVDYRSDGSYNVKRGYYFIDNCRIGLDCIGFLNEKFAVCKFDYWHDWNKRFDTVMCQRHLSSLRMSDQMISYAKSDKCVKSSEYSLKNKVSKIN